MDDPIAVPTRRRGVSGQFTYLDPDRFEISYDVPVFDEHSVDEATYDALGNETGVRTVLYSQDVLQSMCNNMNERISDTGDYTAICIGHTPTPAERRAGVDQPDCVGFAGPYYVGMIGTISPRPAIIARNWAIFKEDYKRSLRYPRRSVEVWREENPHDRYFDPIALLGGEMPARDLGLAYSQRRQKQDVLVARYSAGSVAASPGQFNTFLPGTSDDRQRYENSQTQESTMPLQDTDIQQIVAAVMQTQPMQFVTQLMQESQAKGNPTDPAAGLAPPADPMAAAGGAPPMAPPPPAAPPAAPPHAGGGGAPPPPHGGGGPPAEHEAPKSDPHDPTRNARAEFDPLVDAPDVFGDLGKTGIDEAERGRLLTVGKSRYSQVLTKAREVANENAQLKAQLAEVQGTSTKQQRYSRIELLSHEYAIDADAETKFADAASDDAFEARMDGITKYGRRLLTNAAPLVVERTRKNGEANNERDVRVRERIQRNARSGIRKGYHEVVKEIDQELGLAAK